jgi:hypothetical protein
MTDPVEELMLQRCVSDTGFLSRHVLDYNYDMDDESGERIHVGKGGIRGEGPHAEMTSFLDGPGRFKLMLCSRGTYKTTLLQAYAIRYVLANPNARVLFGRHTYSAALEALDAIRDHFERNDKLRDLFGNPVGKQWRREAFTVAWRSAVGSREPTFSAFGTDRAVTGSHPDLIIWDDPITNIDAQSIPLLLKSRKILNELFPVLEKGGRMVLDMTPRDEEDLSFYVRAKLKRDFKVLVLDCGMWVVGSLADGYRLEGTPRFPHHTKNYL